MIRFIEKMACAALLLIMVQSCTRQTDQTAAWKLQVSQNGHYLCHADGSPFFWMGDTGWLLPERLTREDAEYYLDGCRRAGFNVVQVQTVNGIPAHNIYGESSMPNGFDFSKVDEDGPDGYWNHMDYIIDEARERGIYIGMVCVWGGLVKSGLMDEQQAAAYGKFLADRYRETPNIVWIIGGDIRGDVKPEVWNALARTIKQNDPNHLMTFHPFGRTSSIDWFHDADWLDFNMFQSGHRRYDQTRGDGDETARAAVAEDNWRYVEAGWNRLPTKPILDGEPSYEEIPQGLHDPEEPWWKASDARRYAYWSVFAGAFGHTYGHNSIMQMHPGGDKPGAYGARKSWREGMRDPGFNQMQYLRNLIEAFPFFERVPDQRIVAGVNGYRYDRVAATRGMDYLLVYTYTNRPMRIDFGLISGDMKRAWWYDVTNGALEYVGEFTNGVHEFHYDGPEGPANDRVLIAIDASRDYLAVEQNNIPAKR